MIIKNFALREFIYFLCEDPEPGTAWRSWWDGNEPKIPSYLAKLLWWSLSAADAFFISPSQEFNPPDAYRIIDEDLETAVQNIEHDLTLYLQKIAALRSSYGLEIPNPYEFESLVEADDFLRQDGFRAMAAYTIYCFDKVVTGLLMENASLAAMGSSFGFTAMDIFHSSRSNPVAIKKLAAQEAMSEHGRHAANIRHARTRAMEAEAIRIYLAQPKWPSRRQAAKAIYPQVQAYGKKQHQYELSAERGEQTVYEWLGKYDKGNKAG